MSPNNVDVTGFEPRRDARDAERDRVVDAVLNAGVTFWRDARDEAYATVPREGRIERHPVRSRTFRNAVRLIFGELDAIAPVGSGATPRPGVVRDQTLSEALGAFEAIALRGEVRDLRPRVCRHGEAVWLDLGGPDWRLVRIAPTGWDLVEGADVPLVRPPGLLALPVPARRGAAAAALAPLAGLLNLRPGGAGAVGADHLLVAAWLVAALHPEGPYPVLALDGEAGSGKSTASRLLRRLVDPNLADLRSPPRGERDLLVAACNARVLAFDNLSEMRSAMADTLCMVATGGGLGERRLRTNGEEHLAYVQNPILLNGIPRLLERGDLADRAITITLSSIPEVARRPEAGLRADFETAAPGILALLLDGLVLAQRDGPGLRLPRLPRMADFARLACAAAPAFGADAEQMLAALEANRAITVAEVIGADPVAAAVEAIACGSGGWSGTPTELWEEIRRRTPPEQQHGRDWPKTASVLSVRLRRAAPALRQSGVVLDLSDTGGRAGRQIRIGRAIG